MIFPVPKTLGDQCFPSSCMIEPMQTWIAGCELLMQSAKTGWLWTLHKLHHIKEWSYVKRRAINNDHRDFKYRTRTFPVGSVWFASIINAIACLQCFMLGGLVTALLCLCHLDSLSLARDGGRGGGDGYRAVSPLQSRSCRHLDRCRLKHDITEPPDRHITARVTR